MITRYAGKHCRSPYPKATRTKAINFLLCLSLGGRFGIPPGQILFLCWRGRLFLLEGHVSPMPPTSHISWGRRWDIPVLKKSLSSSSNLQVAFTEIKCMIRVMCVAITRSGSGGEARESSRESKPSLLCLTWCLKEVLS